MVVRSLLLATSLALPLLASASGTVEVKFVEPARYTDAGIGSFEVDNTTHALAEHFKWLARRLPDGQTLKVDVLDVDLAGNPRPSARFGDKRVLRGGLDIPKLTLRYELLQGDKLLTRGEETVSEINYLSLPRRGESHNGLPYEERLLTRWFDSRFSEAAQAQ